MLVDPVSPSHPACHPTLLGIVDPADGIVDPNPNPNLRKPSSPLSRLYLAHISPLSRLYLAPAEAELAEAREDARDAQEVVRGAVGVADG